ncbi:hypothetical protein [Salinicoccus roseus]|nr:hypothetical protein [Salinicoccus roseus]GGA62869.1 hypothetical protein GCM10007176_04170 [Salinicoccus roseus]
MILLTRKDIEEMEAYYFWTGQPHWCPFLEAFKSKLLDVYGAEPYPYEWTDQDIHEGTRKIISAFFNDTNQ